MKFETVAYPLTPTDLVEQRDNLLVIGEIDAEMSLRHTLLTGDLDAGLLAIGAFGFLARQLLQRKSDGLLHYLGGRIFMRLETHPLLQSKSVYELLTYVELFAEWCSARQTLITADSSLVHDPLGMQDSVAREAAARESLEDYRRHEVGNDCSLDDTFRQWVSLIADIRPVVFKVGAVDGNLLCVTIPPKPQILPASSLPSAERGAVRPRWSHNAKVVTHALVVSVVGGRPILVPSDENTKNIKAGMRIGYVKVADERLTDWYPVEGVQTPDVGDA